MIRYGDLEASWSTSNLAAYSEAGQEMHCAFKAEDGELSP